jgi:hypothetical protein
VEGRTSRRHWPASDSSRAAVAPTSEAPTKGRVDRLSAAAPVCEAGQGGDDEGEGGWRRNGREGSRRCGRPGPGAQGEVLVDRLLAGHRLGLGEKGLGGGAEAGRQLTTTMGRVRGERVRDCEYIYGVGDLAGC